LKLLRGGKGSPTRARSLASPGRGGAKYAGARHARKWSGKILVLTLQVRGFLLLLNIFTCMEKIAVA